MVRIAWAWAVYNQRQVKITRSGHGASQVACAVGLMVTHGNGVAADRQEARSLPSSGVRLSQPSWSQSYIMFVLFGLICVVSLKCRTRTDER